MFKKPFSVHLRNIVSGTDRKKLRRGLEKSFAHLTEDEIDAILPNKAGDLEQLKVATPSRSIIYVLDKIPILVDPTGKGDIFPTINTLWRVPHLLPRVYIKHPAVSTYMVGGADLMLPGVHIPPGGLPPLETDDLVAICVHGNPAPLAVGVCGLATRDIKQDKAGSKGKLVELLQYYGDCLWSDIGGKAVPNAGFINGAVLPLGYDSVEQTLQGPHSFQAASNGQDQPVLPTPPGAAGAAAATASPAVLGAAAGSSPPDPASCSPGASAAADGGDAESSGVDAHQGSGPSFVDALNTSNDRDTPSSSSEDASAAAAAGAPSTSGSATTFTPPTDMDELLELCLLQALHKSLKDSDLPANSNVLWTQHMLPCRPCGTALDIKKSKHKKMSKWLSAYGKSHGLLAVKEDRHSGDIVVTAVHREHTLYTSYRPYKATFQENGAAGSGGNGAAGGTSGANGAAAGGGALHGAGDASGVTGKDDLLIEELYKPTKETKPLFAALNLDVEGLYTSQEVGDAVFAYVQSAGLEANALDKATVVLDVVLCDALFKGAIKKGDTFPSHQPKASLRETLVGRMQLQCRISKGGEQVVKKGATPLVQVSKEKHRGHTVTRIVGMESFLVDPKQFGSGCQRKFACSTTVSDLPGKNSGQEILIQGDVLEHLGDYITGTWHIPKKYLQGAGLGKKAA